MKNTNKKTLRRVIALALLIFTMALLASCGSSTSTASELEVNEKTLTAYDTAGKNNTLTAAQMIAIDKVLAVKKIYFYNLLAASRGYAITDGTDASNVDYTEDKGVNLEYAKTAIKGAITAQGSTITEDVYANLNETDVQALIEGLQEEIDTATQSGILVVVGQGLKWLTKILCGNYYVLGICLFGVVIELLMLYSGIRQQKNSIRQAQLAPKVQAIKNKYKGRTDQPTMQKMQQEIQDMYQKENFSQFSGCLPMIIQLVVVMMLYYVVIDPIHYLLQYQTTFSTALQTFANAPKAAGGMGLALSSTSTRGTVELLSQINQNFIDALSNFAGFSNSDVMATSLGNNLADIPNFTIFGVNFGLVPSFTNWLWVVPVVVFASYFSTMKLQRKLNPMAQQQAGVDPRQQACSNWVMDLSMPALSTFFCFKVPAIIGVYWAFRSWLGFLKTFIISKAMPLPTYTEEDVKAAEREMKGKRVVVKSENAGLVRSLHHIDDEDYDDTREAALARKAKMEELEAEKKAKEQNKLSVAGLKETNKHENKKDGVYHYDANADDKKEDK